MLWQTTACGGGVGSCCGGLDLQAFLSTLASRGAFSERSSMTEHWPLAIMDGRAHRPVTTGRITPMLSADAVPIAQSSASPRRKTIIVSRTSEILLRSLY